MCPLKAMPPAGSVLLGAGLFQMVCCVYRLLIFCTVRLLHASTALVGCSCFFATKEGPYKRTWSFAQVKEAFSARSISDWADWLGAKIKFKVIR